MALKHSGSCYNSIKFAVITGMFLFFVCVVANLQSQAQSFFYYENKTLSPEGQTLTYHSLLFVNTDGSGVARVRYNDPATNDDRLLELNLTDSILPGSENSDSLKYLVPVGDISLIAGISDSGFLVPRFIFKEQSDSLGTFYIAYTAEIKSADGKWNPFTTISTQERSFNELKNMMTFVKNFYSVGEPMFDYIMKSGTRGGPELRKEKMFLVIVANTKDPTIGITSQKDFNNISESFEDMATEMGIQKVITSYIHGSDFSKAAVETALAKLNPDPIDIVIFYYSGHGFRYTEDKSKYPRMSFRTTWNPSRENNNLAAEDVFNKILKKKAKVTIVITDCCNEDIGAAPKTGRSVLKTRGNMGKFNQDNAKKLFFPPEQLSIIIGSAEINQLATGNPGLGGFFSYFFMSELEKSLYSYERTPASWLKISADAKEKARYQALTALCGNARCIQTAEIKVDPPQ